MKNPNQVVVITGASKGLGAELATDFASKGFSLALCARHLQPLEEIAKGFRKDGIEVLTKACNVGNIKEVKSFAKAIKEEFNKVDVLINNASILGPRTPLSEIAPEVWREVIEVNLNGAFYVTKEILPLMGKGGSIINISSGVTLAPRENWGPYGISKFGLEALSNNLALELKPRGIRVNIVDPGAMRTEMRAKAYPEEDPLTLPKPEELLDVFRYLSSEKSAGVTGQRFSAKNF
ncbi:MAG TPA: SDR family oxidoreductase, partial [Bdellovibrionota bacterium]|nr:SDR family oxidoreductase [Bdellovibrionota bacterium]